MFCFNSSVWTSKMGLLSIFVIVALWCVVAEANGADHPMFRAVVGILTDGLCPPKGTSVEKAMVNHIAFSKNTLLHLGASNNCMDLARNLIEMNADKYARDRWNCIPLMVAARSGSVGVAAVLLREDDGNKQRLAQDDIGAIALHFAVVNNKPEVVRLLLNNTSDSVFQAQLTAPSYIGTPLSLAIEKPACLEVIAAKMVARSRNSTNRNLIDQILRHEGKQVADVIRNVTNRIIETLPKTINQPSHELKNSMEDIKQQFKIQTEILTRRMHEIYDVCVTEKRKLEKAMAMEADKCRNQSNALENGDSEPREIYQNNRTEGYNLTSEDVI